MDETETTNPDSDAARTVWVAEGRTIPPKADVLPDGAMAGPFQRMHIARVLDSRIPEKVVGAVQTEEGVQEWRIHYQGDTEASVSEYRFDADKFTVPQAQAWLSTHQVKLTTFEPAAGPGGTDQFNRSEGDPMEPEVPVEPPGEEPVRSEPVDPNNDRTRSISLKASSWDEATGSCEAVVATDDPVFSTEVRTGKAVHEVWRIDGMECDESIPLLDSHNARTCSAVLGSLRNCSPSEHEATGRLFISEAEPRVRTKVREGHIRDVSGRASPLETTVIPPGQSATVRGSLYMARKDQPLTVHTRWRLREVSLTPLGADPKAKIRSLAKEKTMNDKVRKYLETIGLEVGATDEQVKEFYDSLPEKTRAMADVYEPLKAPVKEPEKPAVDQDKIRAEGAENERKRSVSVRKIVEEAFGVDKEPDLIRSAVDDGWTEEKTRESVAFLQKFRNRTEPAAPAAQLRSVEKDMTVAALGAAMVIRSMNNIDSGSLGATFASNPTNLLHRYRQSELAHNGIGDWHPDFPTRELNESERKLNETLLNQAERFRNMSIPDICRHCLRIGGHNVGAFLTPNEVVSAVMQDVQRAGPSGGAFNAIFTTNFNALFLAGYLEATDTTLGWVTEGDAPNFMKGELATAGKMGHLTMAGKGKADDMTYGDWNESIKVDRYSGMFEVDEQDLINDRFGMLNTQSPQEMGLAARRLRPNLVYSILLNGYSVGTGRGPTLNQDAGQLFNATATTTAGGHANFLAAASNDLYTPSTGAVGTTGLQAAIPAIKAQRLNGIPLNLVPRFAIISPYLDMALRVALFSTQRIVASGSGGTLNPLQAFNIEVRADSRMDDVGSVDPRNKNAAVAGLKYHYILACRPGEEGAKTVHINYLSGTGRAPQMRSYVLGGPGAPGRWGIGWDIKHDIGAAVADFRGLYYAESST